MLRPRLRSLLGLLLFVCAVRGQEYLLESQDEEELDWSRNFRVGALVGFNIKASFRTGGGLGVSGAKTGIYDDGYVLQDNTGNARHLTSNWGYQSAAQYNAATHKLTMHRSDTFTTDTDYSVGANDSPYFGFDLAYGGNLWKRERVRVGWEFGFGLLPIEASDSQRMRGAITRSALVFDTTGVEIMPDAPYEGGPEADRGLPLISDRYDVYPGDTVSSATNSGSRKIELMLYTFRLGPSLHWDVSPRWAVSASAGAVLGFASGEYRYNETVTYPGGSVKNKGRINFDEITWGASVGATVMYHVEDNGDLYLGVQYMPLGSVPVNSQNRQARLDLDGQVSISAGINWWF